MFIKYILISLLFFLHLNASLNSECINIEKEYFIKKKKSMSCYVTEFTERDDKFYCIEESYNRFNKSINSLFNFFYKQEDNDNFELSKNKKIKPFIFYVKKGKEFCRNLSNKVNDIFLNVNHTNKKYELRKALKKIKKQYKNRLLDNLILKRRDIPKICAKSLKYFLTKKLKSSKFLYISRNSYYDCLDNHPPHKGTILIKDSNSIDELSKKIEQLNKKEKEIKKLCRNIAIYYKKPVTIDVFKQNLKNIFKIFNNPIVVEEQVSEKCTDLIYDLNILTKEKSQVKNPNSYQREISKLFTKEENRYFSFLQSLRERVIFYDVRIFMLDKRIHIKADNPPEDCYVEDDKDYFIGRCDCVNEVYKNELIKNYSNSDSPTIIQEKTKEQCKKY